MPSMLWVLQGLKKQHKRVHRFINCIGESCTKSILRLILLFILLKPRGETIIGVYLNMTVGFCVCFVIETTVRYIATIQLLFIK